MYGTVKTIQKLLPICYFTGKLFSSNLGSLNFLLLAPPLAKFDTKLVTLSTDSALLRLAEEGLS